MSQGDLIYDSATGNLVYDVATGSLVYQSDGVTSLEFSPIFLRYNRATGEYTAGSQCNLYRVYKLYDQLGLEVLVTYVPMGGGIPDAPPGFTYVFVGNQWNCGSFNATDGTISLICASTADGTTLTYTIDAYGPDVGTLSGLVGSDISGTVAGESGSINSGETKALTFLPSGVNSGIWWVTLTGTGNYTAIERVLNIQVI